MSFKQAHLRIDDSALELASKTGHSKTPKMASPKLGNLERAISNHRESRQSSKDGLGSRKFAKNLPLASLQSDSKNASSVDYFAKWTIPKSPIKMTNISPKTDENVGSLSGNSEEKSSQIKGGVSLKDPTQGQRIAFNCDRQTGLRCQPFYSPKESNFRNIFQNPFKVQPISCKNSTKKSSGIEFQNPNFEKNKTNQPSGRKAENPKTSSFKKTNVFKFDQAVMDAFKSSNLQAVAQPVSCKNAFISPHNETPINAHLENPVFKNLQNKKILPNDIKTSFFTPKSNSGFKKKMPGEIKVEKINSDFYNQKVQKSKGMKKLKLDSIEDKTPVGNANKRHTPIMQISTGSNMKKQKKVFPSEKKQANLKKTSLPKTKRNVTSIVPLADKQQEKKSAFLSSDFNNLKLDVNTQSQNDETLEAFKAELEKASNEKLRKIKKEAKLKNKTKN